MKRKLLLFCSLLCSPLVLLAESKSPQYQGINKQARFSIIKQAAEYGDVDSQTVLGGLYKKGEGVEQSDVEAAKWFLIAAKNGNLVAMQNIGGSYYTGEGVRQDYAEAAKWWRKAAQKEFPLR